MESSPGCGNRGTLGVVRSAARIWMQGAALALPMAGLSSITAMAQDSSDQTTELKAVTVTGSNIPRTTKETAAPIQTISRNQIEATGKQNIAEIIQSVSANNSDSLPLTFTSGFASGGSGVSLRGLGVDNTLVLINGRRMAPYGLADDGERTFVDLNSIPLEAVDRIEIFKDGASAIYGSDAIGGVVNVILRKNYQGGTIGATYGASGHNDGVTKRVYGTFGIGNLETQHFNLFATVEATSQQAISNANRSGYLGTTNLAPYGFFDMRAGAPQIPGFGPNTNPYFQPATPYGVISESGAVTTAIPNTGNASNTTGNYNMSACPDTNATTGVCEFDNIGYAQIQPQQDRFNIYTRGTYEFNDSITGYLEAGYFYSGTVGITTPSFIGGEGVSYNAAMPANPVYFQTFDLPATHPDNPSGMDINTANGPYFGWEAIGAGPRIANEKNNVIRLITGITGKVLGGTYDFGGGFLQNRLDNINQGYLQLNATQAALTNGTLRVDPSLDSPTLWASLAPTLKSIPVSRTSLVDGHYTRPLLTMPWGGGDLSFAMGAEYRNENYKSPATPGTNDGQTIGLGFSQAYKNRDVGAVYIEFEVPLTRYADLNAAYRLDHYSDFGYASTPKVELKLTPIKQVSLRGTYAEAFRAPGPAESGAQSASFGFTGIGILTVGNPTLQPEKAKSLTLGTVLEPITGSSLSVDFFRIVRDHDIEEADPSVLQNQFPQTSMTPLSCVNGTQTPGSQACYGPLGSNGQAELSALVAPYQNGDYTKTQGIDFDWEEQLYKGKYGKLSADLTWTHVITFTRDLDGEITQYVGTSGPFTESSDTGTPRDHATLDLNFAQGSWSWTAIANFVGKMRLVDNWAESLSSTAGEASDGVSPLTNSNGLAVYQTSGGEEFPGYAVANPNAQACGIYGPNGTPFANCRVRAFTTMDLFAKYTGFKNWELSGSVLNVFNSMAPLDPYTYGGANYNPAWHQSGAVGRFFDFGVKYLFK